MIMWPGAILCNTRVCQCCQLLIHEILTQSRKMAGICRSMLLILVSFPVLCLYQQASLASPGNLFLNDTYDLVAKLFGISKFPQVTQLPRKVSPQCMDRLINIAFNPKDIFLCEYTISRLFMVNLRFISVPFPLCTYEMLMENQVEDVRNFSSYTYVTGTTA